MPATILSDNKRILALDASSTAVGWCMAYGRDYVSSGVYRPKGKQVETRIKSIVQWFMCIAEGFSPQIVAIELPAGSHGNLRTDRVLARIYGALEALCILRSAIVIPIYPQSVKATGFCKDTPVETGLFIQSLLTSMSDYFPDETGRITKILESDLIERISKQPDEADAIGVWQAALVKLGSK